MDFSLSVPSGIMQNRQFCQRNSRRNIMEKRSRLITKDFMEITVYQMIAGSLSLSVGDQRRTDWTVTMTKIHWKLTCQSSTTTVHLSSISVAQPNLVNDLLLRILT